MDNQFQFAIMATEDRIRAAQQRRDRSSQGTKRVFRLSGERHAAREIGRR
ncbi:MAG: hypothetical protein OEW24_01230 [Chloroflexota bacterium]|nr:hypothetical protein [Chloroflexota bacterium]